ncbi:hypothetical protein KKC17_01865 [Patescibacteria group bacterium]|nr:hypothetical protein [Patescibacteria group bacterium]
MSKTKIIFKILSGLLYLIALIVLFTVFGVYSLILYGLKFIVPPLKRKLAQIELASAPKW